MFGLKHNCSNVYQRARKHFRAAVLDKETSQRRQCLWVALIIPPLKKYYQLSLKDTQKTQAMTRLRCLIERAIHRVKEYNIWDGLVPLSMVGLVNQLRVKCCRNLLMSKGTEVFPFLSEPNLPSLAFGNVIGCMN